MRLKQYLGEYIKDSIKDALKPMNFVSIKDGNTKSSIICVTDKYSRPRNEIMMDMVTYLVDELGDCEEVYFDPNDTTISSMGCIKCKFEGSNYPIKITLKLKRFQGKRGIANEEGFEKLINNIFKKYGRNIDIIFKDNKNNTFTIKNANGIVHVGKDTSNNSKSDVKIRSDMNNIPISIKKTNAQYYLSGDTLYGNISKTIIDDLVSKGLIELIESESGDYFMTKPNSNDVTSIALKLSDKSKRSAMFGSDIENNGCIMIFDFNDITYIVTEEGKVIINVNRIIKNMNEAKDIDLYLLIRTEKGRNKSATKVYRGIRPVIVTSGRISNTTIVIKDHKYKI